MRYTFALNLSAEDLRRYYQGNASLVSVRSEQGEVIRFAARHLRPFLTTSGIHARFELITDQENRFKQLKKIP